MMEHVLSKFELIAKALTLALNRPNISIVIFFKLGLYHAL